MMFMKEKNTEKEKATGFDGTILKFLKRGGMVMATRFRRYLNLCLTRGNITEDWRVS